MIKTALTIGTVEDFEVNVYFSFILYTDKSVITMSNNAMCSC